MSKRSTISAGGRYDYLIEEIGGPPTPGVGFGAGIERLVLALELDRRSLDAAPARRQLSGHGVEGLDERAELVVALRLDPLIEASGADLARRRRQHLHRPGDAFGEIRPHPGRAEQNQ